MRIAIVWMGLMLVAAACAVETPAAPVVSTVVPTAAPPTATAEPMIQVASTPNPTPTPTPTPTRSPTPIPAPTPDMAAITATVTAQLQAELAAAEATAQARITPTPTPEPVLGSRERPVAFGAAAEVRFDATDHWEVAVLAVIPDATELVRQENPFNDPPGDGHQFYIVTIRVKYLGEGSSTFGDSSRLKALGDGGVVYTTLENRCGVIPNRLGSYVELFTNGAIEGAACWNIAASDADSLVLIVEADGFGSNERAWFALR